MHAHHTCNACAPGAVTSHQMSCRPGYTTVHDVVTNACMNVEMARTGSQGSCASDCCASAWPVCALLGLSSWRQKPVHPSRPGCCNGHAAFCMITCTCECPGPVIEVLHVWHILCRHTHKHTKRIRLVVTKRSDARQSFKEDDCEAPYISLCGNCRCGISCFRAHVVRRANDSCKGTCSCAKSKKRVAYLEARTFLFGASGQRLGSQETQQRRRSRRGCTVAPVRLLGPR